MSYLALYRRYRPTTFDTLIGQEHIVKTLKNQIENDKIGHAYLFCGTRGTGKTSTAKIFSKAINCLSPINGSPCNKCEACQALKDAGNIDVVEIDAASNNGVNEIRELRDKITYPPVSVKYKVYIIDEVHMLTTAAFNALLKTLEEPPKHAVFILATTEAHKLPQTILSRCMRFDFKLISTEQIASLVSNVFDDIGKKYEKEAVMQIAKAGEGSIRDALSIADICVSYSDKLTYQDVVDVLGVSDRNLIYEIASSIIESNVGSTLEKVNSLMASGKSVGLLNRDVVSVLRDLIIVKTCKNANAILCLPNDKFNALSLLAEKTSEERLLRSIEIFSEVESELRYSTHPRVVFETALIKASKPEADYNIDALMSRIQALEKRLASGNFTTATPITQVEEKVEEVKAERKVTITESTATDSLSNYTGQEILGKVTRALRQNNELMLWAVVQSLKAEIKGDEFILLAKTENDKKLLSEENNIKAIKERLKEFGDVKVSVKYLALDKKEEEFEKGIDEVAKLFGEEFVVIKN